jgi:hypothetical protein
MRLNIKKVITPVKLLCIFTLLSVFSKSVFAATYEYAEVWAKKNVIVCFDESGSSEDPSKFKNYFSVNGDRHKFQGLPLPDKVRSLVVNTVNKEFSRSTTGISFSGWLSCSKTPHPDVKVAEAKLSSSGSEPFLGITVYKNTRDEYGYVLLNLDAFREAKDTKVIVLNEIDSIRMTIAHEFGHLAGLQHEVDYYEESVDDPKCNSMWPVTKKTRTSFIKRTRDLVAATAMSVGRFNGFDSNSIMNVCQLGYVRRHAQKLSPDTLLLSDLDRATLRYLYP